MSSYTRQDVLRILRIAPRQLRAWERAGLIPSHSEYGFADLVHLRKLRHLHETRLTPARIRAGVDAMQAVSGIANPMLEASAAAAGSRLLFRHSGAIVDPIANQFVFDFDGTRARHPEAVEMLPPSHGADAIGALFLEAVRAEEAGTPAQAVALYESILLAQPEHAPACINLGTIFYNQRQFARAEQLYRRATLADPRYALAFFDLGNVLDELKRLPEAIEAYQAALRLVPRYADAHYNLALAFERTAEPRKALRHWSAYVKLDAAGPWSNHARLQVKRILAHDLLQLVPRPR